MAEVLQTIDVDVPVNILYNQWTQFEEFPRFLSVVDSITQQDDTHNHGVVSIAWTTTGGEVDHAGVVTFHKLSDTSSRVAVQIDWDPSGLVEKAGAALDIPDRAVKHDLGNFKKYIEAEGTADGTWRGSGEN